MARPLFSGLFTALVTPFRGGEIDEPALRRLVDRQVEAGVDGVVPCASTGESATLSHAEHARAVEIAVSEVRGRVRVLAGAGSNSTREAIELTALAKRAGADGALLISPYYNKPTQEGIVAHYAAIAAETEFPLVFYNIPGRTASNLLPATQARLAEIEQVVGVKESSGDLDQVAEVIARCPEGFAVFSGDDALTLPIMALGGAGVISTSANVAPGEMRALVRALQQERLADARRIHLRLMPLFDALFLETNPIPVKAALAMLGLCDGEIRLPLTRAVAATRDRLEAVLKDLGSG